MDKKLIKKYPDNSNYKNGLAISYHKLGNTHSFLGDIDNSVFAKFWILNDKWI